VPIQPGGTLADYVPFYFTPSSPMLLNILTGQGGVTQRSPDEIVIVVSSLHLLRDCGIPFVFTDRHAYLATARFASDLGDLGLVDWDLLNRRNFRRDPERPEQFDRYQAEALAHRSLPASAVLGLGCYNDYERSDLERAVEELDLELHVVVRPSWYFG
jgi:hypothetical protein